MNKLRLSASNLFADYLMNVSNLKIVANAGFGKLTYAA